MGGTVGYEKIKQKSLLDEQREHWFGRRVVSVDFTLTINMILEMMDDVDNNQIDDLTHLANLPDLRELNLDRFSTTDLSPLANLDSDDLAAIWLGNTHANDQQLSHLAGLNGLLWIDVQNSGDITDAGIAHLAELKSLESFGAHWTRISAASLAVLRKMPNLKFVDIWGCEIHADAVEEFLKSRFRDYFEMNEWDEPYDYDLIFDYKGTKYQVEIEENGCCEATGEHRIMYWSHKISKL